MNLYCAFHLDPKSGIKIPTLAAWNVNPDSHGLGMKRERQVEEFEEDDDEEDKEDNFTEAEKNLHKASLRLAAAAGRREREKMAKY